MRQRNRVRVWWPPTDDNKRSGYSGMYWPAQVLQEIRELLLVKYDNGDQEWVQKEDIQPTAAPVSHGREKKPLQRGEFVEVHNNSKTDPAEWVGLVKAVGRESYKITYPFHDSNDETVKGHLIRRVRIWDDDMSQWLYVEPYQNWLDGEVTSPKELRVCLEKDLFRLLASHNGVQKHNRNQE